MSSSGTTRVSLAELQDHLLPRLGEVRLELTRIIEADFPLITEVNSHLLRMQGKLFRLTALLFPARGAWINTY